MGKQNKKAFCYLGGDIMTRGSVLAREEEYNKFKEMRLPIEVYSPVMNKEINDKANVTVEENNCLAEKITEQDIEQLWKSTDVVIETLHSSIGTLTELGCLYGWKYMADHLLKDIQNGGDLKEIQEKLEFFCNQNVYVHAWDLRTNHLPEIYWRRSHSINQLLYGMILYVTRGIGIEELDEIFDHLYEDYGEGVEDEE